MRARTRKPAGGGAAPRIASSAQATVRVAGVGARGETSSATFGAIVIWSANDNAEPLSGLLQALQEACQLRSVTTRSAPGLDLAAAGKTDPYNIAVLYAARGEKKSAFEWFAKALDTGQMIGPLIRYDPQLDALRSDNRFAALLRQHNRASLLETP